MTYAGFVWQCECGAIEYGAKAPKECKKCYRINSYIQIPDEIVEQREKENLEEEMIINKIKVKKINKPEKRKDEKIKKIRKKKNG